MTAAESIPFERRALNADQVGALLGCCGRQVLERRAPEPRTGADAAAHIQTGVDARIALAALYRAVEPWLDECWDARERQRAHFIRIFGC